jgi:DNA-directed RNA polymerase specialized sigma24 family protein
VIDDAFGEETDEQVIARFEHWAHAEAGRRTKVWGPEYDDYVQEARIAIWRALETNQGAPNAVYLTARARGRLLSLTAGKPFVGQVEPGTRHYRPQTFGVDWDVEGDDGVFSDLLEGPDLLSGVDWAYHHGELAEAINSLKPEHRRYVVARFWEGKADVEIAAELGVDRKVLWGWWNRQIKPVLAEHLAALAS